MSEAQRALEQAEERYRNCATTQAALRRYLGIDHPDVKRLQLDLDEVQKDIEALRQAIRSARETEVGDGVDL